MPRWDWMGYLLYAAGLVLNAFRNTRWASPIVLLFACRWIIRGRKLRAADAESLLSADRRPPVLYLRSFAEDQAEAEGSDYQRGMILRTTEEQFAFALSRMGPVVAIGKPGEELPELGAARLYVPEDQWRARVTELIRQARLIVLQLGSTSGFWWEVEQAVINAGPARLLFFVPMGGGPMYVRLASLLKNEFAIEIPQMRRSSEFATIGEKHPGAHFLFFDKARAAKLEPVWPGFFQKGRYSDRAIAQSLGPVFDMLEMRRPPLPWHPWLKWFVLFIVPSLALNYFFSYRPRVEQAEMRVAVARARLEVYGLARSLEHYRNRNGRLPATETWTQSIVNERPVGDRLRQLYSERRIFADPWGQPYHYLVPGIRNPGGFDVFSLGADGKPGGEGPNADVGNWEAPK